MINTYDENGKCTIKWEQVDMNKQASGNLGIGDGTMTLDCSGSVRMGTERMRIADDSVYITSNQEPVAFEFKQPGEVWARVDKDSNVTHLNMDLCAKGPQNAYTALAIAIWNKAVEAAASKAYGVGDEGMYAQIMELKK